MTHETLANTSHEHAQQALRVWLRLLSCSTLIENQVSSRLRSEFDTTLPRFDLMAQLARFPEGLFMGKLSQLLMVSNGNITGITDNLERDGLVERIMLPADRRARRVRLTEKGRLALEQMASTHESWIANLIGGLNDHEQRQLYDLLGKLKHSIQE